ncbi:MAG: alpha/beta fold hydrolase [Alphaproteobacteria bacterium]|jgi:pimeloyl-ACP methyl ester carboxylesterase|nr:alpha/beta fold hydrolase [Alphaproteobacteria bacterium]
MTTFVLVHGAWHGGWCWRRVREMLEDRGERVLTPTLTGLGERAHLLAPEIDLDTHIRDVVNVLAWEDLSDVVLCGHSYGGMVIAGVADTVPERLASLVYLDAFVPRDGEAVVDLLLPDRLDSMKADLGQNGDGWRLSPVPAANFGVEAPTDRDWVDRRCTPQPWATFTAPIRLSGAGARIAKRTFVLAAAYDPSPFQRYAKMAEREPGWVGRSLPTGHDAMVTMPEALTELLLEAMP